ncbi:hypothetical protein AAW00_11485 [Aurantiacibacter luteus]|uniref:Peptidase S8/S53 domain-containing protein n=1 Tax=Aurantiacibacter luteus TaxID=1581420 RepID=A0A0G9MVY0_9SPHN|nr:hypothetical protein AAW00_11485 [Aurantiacibacter luteus]
MWAGGRTGAGVTVAVVDTGIDPDSPEFAGRLSPASKDIYGTRGVEGPDDHGTLVAMVAAAARDNTGILGMAWGSTVLAIRADEPNSCGGDNAADPTTDCAFTDTAIANSIDYAVANGAKVVNLSLGGPDPITSRLSAAVRRAVDSGVFMVVAAGNEGLPELEAFGRTMVDAGNGGLIIAGSVGESYIISDFSNRAGANPTYYLAARGERICCTYENGQLYVDADGFAYLFSGTSFAAPQIAGAAALLAQAFPNLTGRQITDILLRSAFDAGASGPDAVYGRGILDVFRAFQPLGATAIAGQTASLPLGDGTGVASTAMGDAFARVRLPTIVTDEYGRAFSTDLSGTLASAELQPRLYGALGQQVRSVAAGSERASMAFSIDARGRQGPRIAALRLSEEDAEQARVLAAQVAVQLSPRTELAMAYRQGADGLAAQLRDAERPAFMIAGTSRDTGMLEGTDAAFALRHRLGDWGLTVSGESGSTVTAASVRHAAEMRGRRVDEDVASLGLALDRRFGELDTALGLTWTAEDRTVLGARFHEGFGLEGSDTLFMDLDLGWRPADRWRLGASWRQGFTTLADAPLVGAGSRLASNAWALDLARTGAFAPNDTLALRLSQPLRVSGGGVNLLLPSDWSYETLSASYAEHRLDLTPSGRELIGELAWRGALWGGDAGASLFYRHQPGHFAGRPADHGVAFRWGRRF